MRTNTRDRGSAAYLEQKGKEVARKATTNPFLEVLFRLGYVVRGLVYGVIGLLALEVVIGSGGKITDPQGAIVTIGQSPIGSVLVWVILAGLVGYGLWGFIRAIVDPLHKGSDAKGVAIRVGYVVSGISYFLLALPTYSLITAKASAAHSGAQTAQAQEATAVLLSKPWGEWVVGAVGLIIIGDGLMQIYRSLRRDFDQQFEPYMLDRNQRLVITQLGRFGIAARGVVFTMVGFFLFLTALYNDPHQAQGIDGVLYSLLRQPSGPVLLAIVALGLIAFGFYSALSGVWLRLNWLRLKR